MIYQAYAIPTSKELSGSESWHTYEVHILEHEQVLDIVIADAESESDAISKLENKANG